MNKREAKIAAMGYVCVAVDMRQSGDDWQFYEEFPDEKDQEKILAEIREICWALGDRSRRLKKVGENNE